MIRAVGAALLSHWWRSKLQCVALIAGLALATALWSGVQAINAEARASYDAAAATLGEGQYDQLVPRAGGVMPQETYIALRRAGWQVSPVLEGRLQTDNGRVRVLGLDPLTSPGQLVPVGGEDEVDLISFLSDDVIFANAETAARLEGAVSQRVIIDANIAPALALTDIGVAQSLLDADGKITRLLIAPEQPMGLPPVADVAPDLSLQTAQEVGVGRLTDSFHLNLTAFGLLSFAVGIFIVHGTIALAFEQRRSTVRTMRALGVPLAAVIGLIAVELLGFALLSGGIGIVLGYLIAAVLLPDVAATLDGLYGAQVSGTLQLRAEWWLSGLAIAVAGTAVAAIGAFAKLATMPLLASAQPRALTIASGVSAYRLAVLAVVLFAKAAGLAVWGQGLIVGFALLACVLVGAAFLLPLFLRLCIAAMQSGAKTALWQWFWADTRQQIPGMSLALMALLLATAANVGVSTMVSSFRVTFVDFLDQRLAPELYVQTESDTQAVAVQAFLNENAREVLPLNSVDTEIRSVPTELYGVRVGPTYREDWVFLDGDVAAWADVEAGRGVVVSEQLARRAGVWIGDEIAVLPDLTLTVGAIVADYGNPLGQAVMSEALFLQAFPDHVPQRFGVRTNDAPGLRAQLLEFGLPESAIIDQARIKAFSIDVFERTFSVSNALNVLTLIVAAFAILMSLLTLASMRVPQLAPVWALGLTRRDPAQLELLRAILLAALTTVLAIPLGLVLAWVLLAFVNVEAFGWRLPMFTFPLHYAVLSAFAIVAAALAALGPAWTLARTPPAALLKVFANDR